MKKKLRKIIVEQEEYLYLIQRRDDSIVLESACIKVFKKGYKNTPLFINFDIVFEHISSEASVGYCIQLNPFVKGIGLTNKSTGQSEDINIYTPRWVSLYIKYSIAKGWDASKEMYLDGVQILSEWGYDVSFLHHYVWNAKSQITTIKKYK